ncbi:MAG: DUF1592 domain-containing protein, partial [Saprospiraceae bacterium]|nr:DUF1592 domain-containing protein [Saprospiraceae bacterium]
GGLDLDVFYFVPSVVSKGELWQRLVKMVEEGEMPPTGKPRMSEAEKDTLINLVNGILDKALSEPDPGPSITRKLSHREYTYTIKDLMGVDFDAMAYFPKEGSGGEGFDNQSGVLFMTPLSMERYYMAADSILKSAEADPSKWKGIVPKSYRPGLLRRGLIKLRVLFGEENVRWRAPSLHAKRIILPFAAKSYRRFLSQEEQQELLSFFENIYFDNLWKEKDGFDQALATTFKRILISPNFLYRTEINAPIHKPYPISNIELATRLSYFLWSSMPDDTLLQTAYREDLHDPLILNREAARMMRNEKFKRFSKSFAPQWLSVEESLLNPTADQSLFPEFTESIRNSMREEVITYFQHVFTKSKNLLELIDSDYSFLDQDLARHYGVPDINGSEMRPVKVADYGRGGILGMGAVLTATSLPNRTSPVLRGQWVLEQVLGTPAPPPPPDVPALEESDSGTDEMDVRGLLEMHRASPACAGCHQKMDPIGFAMENFDAIGRWREHYKGEIKIDASAMMESGEKINGPVDLRKILASEQEKFAENFSRKMLSYALGRGVAFTDSQIIKDLTQGLLENNFNSDQLVFNLINSYSFRHRRSDMSEMYIKK